MDVEGEAITASFFLAPFLKGIHCEEWALRLGAKVVMYTIYTISWLFEKEVDDWWLVVMLLFQTLGCQKSCYGCAHCLFFFEVRSQAQIVPDLLCGTAWGAVCRVLEEKKPQQNKTLCWNCASLNNILQTSFNSITVLQIHNYRSDFRNIRQMIKVIFLLTNTKNLILHYCWYLFPTWCSCNNWYNNVFKRVTF